MHRFALLAIVGCGGAGGNVGEGESDVQISGPTCDQLGSDSVSIEVEGLFTLAVGNVVDADITVLGAPPGGTVNGFFSCGSWEEVFVGTESVGCQRLNGQPLSMQAVRITHDETFDVASLPVPTMVTIVLNVRPDRGSPTVLASDSKTVGCVVNAR